MVAVIGIVVALIGFAMMSRPFRIGFALYLAFLAYYIYLYGGNVRPSITGERSKTRMVGACLIVSRGCVWAAHNAPAYHAGTPARLLAE
ncbi:hypothetical protein [Pseudomonas sp. NUPR-001]|uniref:hypothetical protein n=1 Tax=Pseudomonas sp. NUPR-001 TaxID=3416058 RepID=UPI003F9899AD